MRLLVLGGTCFLGRGVVDAALAAGDQVTTFTRGVSGDPPDGVEALRGDRSTPGGMDVLRGREWDAVVDTSGFVPVVVGRGAELLADAVGHYVFVSSVNAYPGFPDEAVRDDSPVHDGDPDEGSPDGRFEMEQYGRFKVGSERAVERHFPGRSASLRAGMIVGPYDNTGRFPYWVARMARGGEVLGPPDPHEPVRVIDQRDLGAWAVEVARDRVTGAYVATGPAGQATFAGLLGAMEAPPGTTVTWVPAGFLREQEVAPWTELPLWADSAATSDLDTTAAERAGLRTRPVAESARDVLAWLRADGEGAPNPRTGRAGLDPDKERRVLAAWHDRQD